MSSLGTILGLQPFEPKRRLVLSHEGGVIDLYVLDGEAYLAPIQVGQLQQCRTISTVHFGGWSTGFENPDLSIPKECTSLMEGGFERCILEVVFRLVPAGPDRCHTAEVVAVSLDGQTFYNNHRCTFPQECGEPQLQVG